MSTLVGACHCGAVTVTLPDDAFGVVLCHCGDCQRLHGNAFAMLVADPAQVHWQGEAHIGRYRSSERAERTFCTRCGSRLAKEPVGAARVMISVGLFPADLPRRIRKHVFEHSKPAWYDLPAVEEMP